MQWVIEHYDTISMLIVVLYTIFIRLFPTKKDVDLANLIKNFLDYWLPNIKKGGGFH